MLNRTLKFLVPVFILSFLVWTVLGQWPTVASQIINANYSLLGLALLILVLTHVGGAYFWQRILQSLSVSVPFKDCLRVFIVSNFGRFIPGVILHYIARVYLSRKLGIGTKESVSSVFLEAYYTLVGALLISIFALPVLINFIKFPFSFYNPFFILFIVVLMSAIVFVSPNKFFVFFTKIPYLGNKIPKVAIKKNKSEHLWIICISSSLFFLDGLAFYFLTSAFVYNPLQRVFELSGMFSSTWIIGFLTPVAPGGLGVSDLSFAFILSAFYNFPLASFFVVLFRFGLFLSEGTVLLFVIKLFGFNLINSLQTGDK